MAMTKRDSTSIGHPKTVTCPEGKVLDKLETTSKLSNRAYVQARFSNTDCSGCDAKERCTRSPQRSLNFLPLVQYEALEQAREVYSSSEGKERYKRRAGIEGTLSQGVRGCGLRRSRYRGLAKTHLQNVAIGTAINIDRLFNYFNDLPVAKTRVSRFKALEAA